MLSGSIESAIVDSLGFSSRSLLAYTIRKGVSSAKVRHTVCEYQDLELVNLRGERVDEAHAFLLRSATNVLL